MRFLRQMTTTMAMSLLCAATASYVPAAPEFVNGLALDGALLDRSGGADTNAGRVGYFSDIDYDHQRNQWWGLFEGLAISPDGTYVYAMLQSAMLDEGGSGGLCNRIVKFNTTTGTAIAQYAYQMEGSSQGRGISALFALNDHEFLVLVRNNRGLGIGAELSPPDKTLYRIDIADAVDVSDVTFAPTTCPTGKVTKDSVPFLNLAADTLPELDNKVPEKWEGLAVGQCLKDGSYVMVTGTDNDYSMTQNNVGQQCDVYFRVTDADPFASSIQCPLGLTTGCFTTADITDGIIHEMFDLPHDGSYKLLPAVLHAYKVSAADLGNFVRPGHHRGVDDADDQEDDDKE